MQCFLFSNGVGCDIGVGLGYIAELGWDTANFLIYFAKLRVDFANFVTFLAKLPDDSAKALILPFLIGRDPSNWSFNR